MKKIIDWFKESDRWKHLLGGILIGLFANGWYCALYAGTLVAGALELKDFLWEGEPSWVDAIVTVAGSAIGYGLHCLIFMLLLS